MDFLWRRCDFSKIDPKTSSMCTRCGLRRGKRTTDLNVSWKMINFCRFTFPKYFIFSLRRRSSSFGKSAKSRFYREFNGNVQGFAPKVDFRHKPTTRAHCNQRPGELTQDFCCTFGMGACPPPRRGYVAFSTPPASFLGRWHWKKLPTDRKKSK